VRSHLTKDFRKCFRELPERIQRLARENYKLWKSNPHHNSLDFKCVNQAYGIYSLRIGIGWRALGLKKKSVVIWFWIGSHSDYDKYIQQF
jgi:hypothetical protein